MAGDKDSNKWLVPVACVAAGAVVGVGATVTFMVITERVRTEEEREAAVALLEAANKPAAG